jgi:hypothetical protein
MRILFAFFIFLAACTDQQREPLGLDVTPITTLGQNLIGKWQTHQGPDVELELQFDPNGYFCIAQPLAGLPTADCNFLWVAPGDTIRIVGFDGSQFSRWHAKFWDANEIFIQPYGPNNAAETPFIMKRVF